MNDLIVNAQGNARAELGRKAIMSDPYVRVWDENGHEVAMMSASHWRDLMREITELRAENGRLHANVVQAWDEVRRHFDEGDLFRKRVARFLEPMN